MRDSKTTMNLLSPQAAMDDAYIRLTLYEASKDLDKYIPDGPEKAEGMMALWTALMWFTAAKTASALALGQAGSDSVAAMASRSKAQAKARASRAAKTDAEEQADAEKLDAKLAAAPTSEIASDIMAEAMDEAGVGTEESDWVTSPPKALSIKDLREALLKVDRALGRANVLAILAMFVPESKETKLSNVPEGGYSAFMVECERVLAAEQETPAEPNTAGDADEPDTAGDADEPTFKEVQLALVAYTQSHGRAATVELLSNYVDDGVDVKLPNVDKHNWRSLVDELGQTL